MPQSSAPRLAIIVAIARNGVIGVDGALPWRLKSDLQHFKATSLGKPIVMGRKTWDSLPRRPLPERPNLVVTRNVAARAVGALMFAGPDAAFAAAAAMAARSGAEEFCVIGGASLYEAALPLADTLYLTEVDAEPQGDVFFPAFDRSDWREASVRAHPADADNDHAATYRTLRRR